MTRRCRACRTPRWATDPCPNAACPKNTEARGTVKSVSPPIAATAGHGFHAPNTAGFCQPTGDYDAPIRARTWRTA